MQLLMNDLRTTTDENRQLVTQNFILFKDAYEKALNIDTTQLTNDGNPE